MGKENMVDTYSRLLSALKKKEILLFAKTMDGSEGYYTKGNKPVTEEQIRHDSIYMRYIK